MNFKTKSWKTSVAGALLIIIGVLHVAYPLIFTTDVTGAIVTIATAAGLLVAKDGNVTGGTVLNSSNDPDVVAASAVVDLPPVPKFDQFTGLPLDGSGAQPASQSPVAKTS